MAEYLEKHVRAGKNGPAFSSEKASLNSPEIDNAVKLAGCANFFRTKPQQPDLDIANKCMHDTRDASQKGWIGNLAMTLIAVQQEPFTKFADGTDNASVKLSKVVDGIFDLKNKPAEDKAPFSYICTASDEKKAIKSPITSRELAISMVASSKPTAEMNPNRCIQVDKPGAALLGFADAQLNMERYLDDAGTPSAKTLQQTVTRIFKDRKTDAATIEKKYTLCAANHSTPDSKSECADTAVVHGLSEALKTGVRYKGTQKILPK